MLQREVPEYVNLANCDTKARLCIDITLLQDVGGDDRDLSVWCSKTVDVKHATVTAGRMQNNTNIACPLVVVDDGICVINEDRSNRSYKQYHQ